MVIADLASYSSARRINALSPLMLLIQLANYFANYNAPAAMNRAANSDPSGSAEFRVVVPIDPNETADILGMFTIRARNMQYCGSVTISFVNESLPQRDDPFLHEGYTTRMIVTSKACTWDRSSYVSLGGFHTSSHEALSGSLIIAVCSHWKVVRDYAPLCGVNNVTVQRPRRRNRNGCFLWKF